MNRSILHVNPDDFHASVLRVKDPALKGKPLLIALPFPRSRILSASYEARREGVHKGQRIEEARRLCRRGLWLPPDDGLFRKVSWKLMRFLTSQAPRLEPGDAGELFLDVSGCRNLFGPPEDQARNLRGEILRRFSLEVSVGLASNKLVSRGASSEAKRAGLLDVFPGCEAPFLAPWPLDRLPGVSEGLAQRFEERSVHTVGDLATLPQGWLETWLGPPGLTLYERAQGRDESPVLDPRRRRALSLSRAFEPELLERDILQAHGIELAGDLGRLLRRRLLKVGRLGLSLVYAGNRITRGFQNLSSEVDTDPPLHTATVSLLIRVDQARLRIQKMTLFAERLMASEVQGELWQATNADPARDKERRLSRARDAVRSRFKAPSALYWGSASVLHNR